MNISYQCPTPPSDDFERITLAHGEGGLLTRQLIEKQIQPRLTNPVLERMEDAARLEVPSSRLHMTTDTYVVSPAVFPGGNIGSLAVYGTVNDLLVSGAVPSFLTLGLVLEEGLPMDFLGTILDSIRHAAEECRVQIVAGDTKVVPKGECDQLYINTTGLGVAREVLPSGANSLQPGDELVVTGPLGQHGIAILACREELDFTPSPVSDSRSLQEELESLLPLMPHIRSMRDLTRGGLSAALHEWSKSASLSVQIEQVLLPVTSEAQAVCELLGLDPIHIACEGCMVIGAEAGWGAHVKSALHKGGFHRAEIIGQVLDQQPAPVILNTILGKQQRIQEPLGAPLPRIC